MPERIVLLSTSPQREQGEGYAGSDGRQEYLLR